MANSMIGRTVNTPFNKSVLIIHTSINISIYQYGQPFNRGAFTPFATEIKNRCNKSILISSANKPPIPVACMPFSRYGIEWQPSGGQRHNRL